MKLEIGMTVKFDLARSRTNSAFRVYVGESFGPVEQGIVFEIDRPNIFIVVGQQDISFNEDLLPENTLPLKVGDVVSVVHASLPGRLSVRSVRVFKYKKRSEREIFDFFKEMSIALVSSAADQALTDILSSKPFIELLICFGSKISLPFFISIVKFLQDILKACKDHNQLLVSSVLEEIFASDIFQHEAGILPCLKSTHNLTDSFVLPSEEIKPGLVIIGDFFRFVLEKTPEHYHLLSPFLENVIEVSQIGNVNKAFVKMMIESLSKAGALNTENSWKTLSTFIDEEELTGGLLETDQSLPKVHLNTPYLNGPEYMDTYYRLLRAELYSAIQKGIKDLKSGTLDNRDMNCYFNISLAGYFFCNGNFCLALKFTPSKPVRNWASSPQLMFGNLLCLSPSGRFDDIIWATVAERDENLLKKSSVIVVQICKENQTTTSDVCDLIDTSGGQAVMVESPTYFNALHPVLTALQEIDIDNFSLNQAIVNVQVSAPYQNILKPLYNEHRVLLPLDPVRATEEQHLTVIKKGLDDSQAEAFNHCLDQKLAIIQGPPGTGKTFIGVKIVEALIVLNKSFPILVLTYKNHALDEFLKHLIERRVVSSNQVVRIGGRSKESSLNECNLGELIKYYKDLESADRNHRLSLNREIYEAILDIEEKTKQCKRIAMELDRVSSITVSDIMKKMSKEQLINLVKSNSPNLSAKFTHLLRLHPNLLWSVEQKVASEEKENEVLKEIIQIANKSIQNWLPDRKLLITIQSFHSRLSRNTETANIQKDPEHTQDMILRNICVGYSLY